MAAPPRLVARESWVVTLEQRHYERLLDVRTGLRRFLRWSADQAAMAGVTPAQHQLLLAIRGHPDPAGPTIREIAGYLLVRHHSAVELVDRGVAAGLVERRQDGDLRAVRRCRTADGADRLARLSALHLEELRRFAPQLEALWDGLDMSLEAASSRVTYDPELGCLGWSSSASVRRTWAAMRWRWGSANMPATAPNTNQNQKMASISSSSPTTREVISCHDV
jgi:DNA-binding MarR family transcriptional regulator